MTQVRWPRDALCRFEGHPSDWDDVLDQPWVAPEETEQQRVVRHARAKAVCARCPVRVECQEHCDMDRDSGIWFGVHLERWRQDRGQLRRNQAVRGRSA